MITAATTLQELFNEACMSANANAQSGEKFIVRDLFRGIEWSRIPRGLRTKLGSMFFAYVNGEAKDLFDPIGKTQQNQQIYIKK